MECVPSKKRRLEQDSLHSISTIATTIVNSLTEMNTNLLSSKEPTMQNTAIMPTAARFPDSDDFEIVLTSDEIVENWTGSEDISAKTQDKHADDVEPVLQAEVVPKQIFITHHGKKRGEEGFMHYHCWDCGHEWHSLNKNEATVKAKHVRDRHPGCTVRKLMQGGRKDRPTNRVLPEYVANME